MDLMLRSVLQLAVVAALSAVSILGAPPKLVALPGTALRSTDQATGIGVTVRLSPFEAGAYEVTQREFREVLGFNPSANRGDSLPVENVSWWEAIRYCNLRSLAEKLQPCYNLTTGDCGRSRNGYRLLTEAEWTYALGQIPEAAGLPNFAWLGPSATKDTRQLMAFARTNHTRPVGSLSPNEHGLYDMLGNVWEWVQDYQDPSGAISSSTNPSGPSLGIARVVRGGSWISTTSRWGSGYRSSLEPDRRSPYTGFRICRSIPGGPAAVPLNESWFAPYNQVPAAFKNLTGTLTPLAKGIPDIAAWTKQRLILYDKWAAALGVMDCAKPAPNVRHVRTDREPAFTGELMYLQVEPDYWEKIYLMLPNGADLSKALPVVIVPFYDVDTAAGKNLGGRRTNPLGTRSYGYLAVQQG
ncbi:MAG: formylglycine-generating enzyme family protein, partial [Acidobacteriota bacterium]|nr:formylglycine-generating enzyme family protein [Acidobacteriota bacterium]